MRKSLKPKFLGFIAAAGVHLSREQKKARNIEKHVIDLGRSVFGINLSNADDVVLAIDALGREGRRPFCEAYRSASGVKKSPKIGHGTGHKTPKGAVRSPNRGGPNERKIRAFYLSSEWSRLSYKTKIRRGRVCECCGARPPHVRIHTDHIKPIRHFWDLRLDESNLHVLCEDCNRGKGSWDETDFRSPDEA